MCTQSYNRYLELFNDYLNRNGLKKTKERISVLERIIGYTERFDAESLYIQMKNEKLQVSMSTVYNTLELLLTCEILKIFPDRKSHYQINLNVIP